MRDERFLSPGGARRAWRRVGDGALSPVTASLLLSFVVVALIILVTGTNPWTAYTEMWKGATSGSGPRTVVNRAIPIVGMAIALSTRIVVMFDGRIVAELDPLTTDEVEIGLYMTGARTQEHVDV